MKYNLLSSKYLQISVHDDNESSKNSHRENAAAAWNQNHILFLSIYIEDTVSNQEFRNKKVITGKKDENDLNTYKFKHNNKYKTLFKMSI